MPVYTYRRQDGTTFDVRQKFTDDPLKVDPETGQQVVRVVQAAGVIFKGSGFYINDSKSKSASTLTNGNGKHNANGDKADKATEATALKPESKTETTTTAGAAAD